MKGTLINTATVTAGAAVGYTVGRFLPPSYQQVAIEGVGLVVSLIGVKMFFASKNAVISVAAIALGGMIGAGLGIAPALANFADWMKTTLGGGGHFTDAIITTTVLYCVGPMTLLGCLQDGIEGKTELLIVKSTLDGITAIFFTATMGPGVFVTALILLLLQGSLTLLARRLQQLAKDENMIAEASAVGGALMLAIGLGVLGIKKIHAETYLPALILAPAFAALAEAVQKRRKGS